MNWLDVAIVATIAGFIFTAYRAGLVREVITLAALVAGIIIAGLLYEDLAMQVVNSSDDTALAISFIILLGSVYLMGQIVAYTLKKGVSLLMLGWIDRVGGAFFGLLKGLLLVQVLLLVFAAYPGLGMDEAVDGSSLAPFFIEDVDFLLALLPSDFDEGVEEFLNS